MTGTRTVRPHMRDGRRVAGYRQSYQSRGQQAADAAMGVGIAAGGVTTAVLGLTEAVLNIVALSLLALFGAVLGVRMYRRSPRRWTWRKTFKARRRRRVSGPPARRTAHEAAPWAGAAPWGGQRRSGLYRVEPDGVKRIR